MIIQFLQNISLGFGLVCLINTENIIHLNIYHNIFILLASCIYSSRLFIVMLGFVIAEFFELSGGFASGILFYLGNVKIKSNFILISTMISLLLSFILFTLNYDTKIIFFNQKWLFDLVICLVVFLSLEMIVGEKC